MASQPTLQGVEAVDALLEATPETPSYMIGISENQITRQPLMKAVELVGPTCFRIVQVADHMI